jgi:hypothetical protein
MACGRFVYRREKRRKLAAPPGKDKVRLILRHLATPLPPLCFDRSLEVCFGHLQIMGLGHRRAVADPSTHNMQGPVTAVGAILRVRT